jgi:hypothetical protein
MEISWAQCKISVGRINWWRNRRRGVRGKASRGIGREW